VQINITNNGEKTVSFIDKKMVMDKMANIDGVTINLCSTTETSGFLVKMNSRMYNKEIAYNQGFMEDLKELSLIREEIINLLKGRTRKDLKDKNEYHRLDELEEKEENVRKAMTDVYRRDIPSLIIVTTIDTELAHIGGYDGEFIYQHDEKTGKVFFRQKYEVEYLDDDDALAFQNWK
jgi:hypothetical protein